MTLHNIIKTAPTPLIDNLTHLGNPLLAVTRMLGAHPVINQLDATEQLAVQQDLLHSLSFLVSYNGSQATFNTYRREVERLLQWCWFVQGSSLTQLSRQDIESYLQFVQSPPAAWIGIKNVARFKNQQGQRIANPDWRPFVSSLSKIEKQQGKSAEHSQFLLSEKALQSLFAVISSYFNYLLQEAYCQVNPVALIRQKSKYLKKQSFQEPVRRISNLQWDFVIETAELLAAKNPAQHERSLFVMNCLFAMYLRISELVADERSTPVMGDFHQDQDKNWWLRVTGKGNKIRLVTVSDDMLNALRRYRIFLGLSPLPYTSEQTPMVRKIKGRGSVTSTRQIRFIVQDCFDQAFERMNTSGLAEEAQELRVATVHWLRHTGISEDVKIRPKEHVREDAGHASMVTTDRYIDTELRERHASAKHKKIKSDD